jgi:toxin ParE1/3/4
VKIIWSASAQLNLADIVHFIASENPHAALHMDELLSEAASKLREFPCSGGPGLIAETRELLPHRSYRIVYGEVVRILNIIHTSRQWPPVEDKS